MAPGRATPLIGRAGWQMALDTGSSGHECVIVNGFQCIPELEAISCADSNVAPFSLPIEALEFTPPPDLVVSPFENGDKERRIHCNVELQAYEQEKLAMMQREANAQGLKFYPSVSAMATRFLNSARMDVKKALKSMQATQEWRKNYFRGGPITDSSVFEDMKHGIVYFTGRDRDLRPAMVVRGRRIPYQWYREKRVDRLIRLLVFCMEYMLRYLVVPGRVENLCVIVDMKGVGLSQVSVSALNEIHRVMTHHFSGRVYRFYVANVPHALSMIAGMVKSLLTDRQKQKIVMLRDTKELRENFALHHLEEDLGGTRPAIKRFFPFPLLAGPFEGGCDTGPDAAAVAGVHRVLTATSVVGHLWDPSKSRKDNVAMEYSPQAKDILERCRLVPCSPTSTPTVEGAATNNSFSTEDELKPQGDQRHGDEQRRDVPARCELPRYKTEASTEEGTSSSADQVELERESTPLEDAPAHLRSTELDRALGPPEDAWASVCRSPRVEAAEVEVVGGGRRRGWGGCWCSCARLERPALLSL